MKLPRRDFLHLYRFSAAGEHDLSARSDDRRLKSAKARNRGGGWYDGSAAGYGDLGTRLDLKVGRLTRAIRLEWEYNLNVPARILLNGDFTFCPIHDFNELSV